MAVSNVKGGPIFRAGWDGALMILSSSSSRRGLRDGVDAGGNHGFRDSSGRLVLRRAEQVELSEGRLIQLDQCRSGIVLQMLHLRGARNRQRDRRFSKQ